MTKKPAKKDPGQELQGIVQAHSLPYPASRLAPPIELVDLAREIEQADQLIDLSVHSKLTVISEQINALQKEARKILAEAKENSQLHRVECKFKRQPGGIYHLYQKPNGTRYFSMLSPQDWKHTPPHSFVGSFRLEADRSWTKMEALE
jgi:hypothetical protein